MPRPLAASGDTERSARRLVRSTALVCILALGAALLLSSSAPAAVQVTSTADPSGGTCTLREAIEAVNNHASSGGCSGVEASGETIIEVPANTYGLASQLEIKAGAEVRIVGIGGFAVLDGGNHNRVLEVASGATATLVGIEVTHGRAHNAPVPVSVYQAFPGESGGGIYNKGTLTLENDLVLENQAGNGANGLDSEPLTSGGSGSEGGSGGGIYNSGSLTIFNTTIGKNLTGAGGTGGDGGEGETPAVGHFANGLTGGKGGPAGDGGGIFNSGSLHIEDSTVSENATARGGNGGSGGQGAGAQGGFGAGRGGDGGEGGNSGRQYQKNEAEFEDAERGGGGIYNAGSLEMVNSTIYKNNTGAGGNGGSSASGGAREISGFETSGRAGIGGGAGRGGGLFSGGAPHTPVHLTNVTIYANRTGDGGNGGGGGGGAADTLGGGAGGYGGDGGGLFTQGPSSGGSEVVLTNVTIAGNGVGAAGLAGNSARPEFGAPGVRGVGAGIATGGRYNPSGFSIFEKNSIVAGNGNPAAGDTNCHTHYRPEQYEDFDDLGYNITFPAGGASDATCPGVTADPGLGTFGSNGGPTQTLVPSGAAVGIVPLAACTVHEDQRGNPRPAPGKQVCDAGAVETGTGSGTPPDEEEGGGEEEGGTPGGGTGGGSSAPIVPTPLAPITVTPPVPAPPAPAAKKKCRKGSKLKHGKCVKGTSKHHKKKHK